MGPSDLDRLEQELGIRLPAIYRELVASYPPELHQWPKLEGATYPRRTAFLLDVEALLKANESVRKKLKKEWPEQGFVIGGDPEAWWLIDTAVPDPRVQLVKRDMVLGAFPNLTALFEAVRADHAEAVKKAAKAAKAGPKPKLTPEELLEEGRRLARPAVSLHKRGSDYAAVWKGTGVVSPGDGEWRHWISIDARFLPQNPGNRTGVISVYDWFADDDRMGDLLVVHDSKATLPEQTDGTRLYAKQIECMPDVDAIFHFGSQKVKDWVSASWDPDKGYDRSPVKEYLKILGREHPFQGLTGAYAMLGGWSWCFNWCYGTDEAYPWHLFDQALAVLTIEDSEPWIEVFDDGITFTANSRIT